MSERCPDCDIELEVLRGEEPLDSPGINLHLRGGPDCLERQLSQVKADLDVETGERAIADGRILELERAYDRLAAVATDLANRQQGMKDEKDRRPKTETEILAEAMRRDPLSLVGALAEILDGDIDYLAHCIPGVDLAGRSTILRRLVQVVGSGKCYVPGPAFKAVSLRPTVDAAADRMPDRKLPDLDEIDLVGGQEAESRERRDATWAHALQTAVERHFPMEHSKMQWRESPVVPDVDVVCGWMDEVVKEAGEDVVGGVARLLKAMREGVR